MQHITNEMVVAKFGDSHDGISVYKGERRVGYLTDLRTTIARDLKKKVKQKEYSTKQTEERREAMPEAVQEMVDFLTNNLSKYGAEVFINFSQPNVHLNGVKCYIICDPLTDKFNRLGIAHPSMTAEDMMFELETYKVQTDAPKHVLVNGLSRDDIVEIITKLCSK